MNAVTAQNPAPEARPADTSEQMHIRRDKREKLLANGEAPYPVKLPRTHSLAEVRAKYPELEPDTATGEKVGEFIADEKRVDAR